MLRKKVKTKLLRKRFVLSPFIWVITFLGLGYADDLSILDESLSKINELLEFLRVKGARIGLKINDEKTKSLRLGIK
jgi:hypothetical protein